MNRKTHNKNGKSKSEKRRGMTSCLADSNLEEPSVFAVFALIVVIVRTHRERKEAYIASLEAEVVQLRANEARISEETKKLYAEINILKGLLQKNGIPAATFTIPESARQLALPDDKPRSKDRSNSPEPSFTLKIAQEGEKINRRKQIYSQRTYVQAGNEQRTVEQMKTNTSDSHPATASSTAEGLRKFACAMNLYSTMFCVWLNSC